MDRAGSAGLAGQAFCGDSSLQRRRQPASPPTRPHLRLRLGLGLLGRGRRRLLNVQLQRLLLLHVRSRLVRRRRLLGRRLRLRRGRLLVLGRERRGRRLCGAAREGDEASGTGCGWHATLHSASCCCKACKAASSGRQAGTLPPLNPQQHAPSSCVGGTASGSGSVGHKQDRQQQQREASRALAPAACRCLQPEHHSPCGQHPTARLLPPASPTPPRPHPCRQAAAAPTRGRI